MRQLTVTIPDDFYKTFIAFLKFVPEVLIEENIKLKQSELLEESIWYESNQPPEVVNQRNGLNGYSFSVEVLTYSATKKSHNIAFYDYKKEAWHFLLREPEVYFRWRYFDKRIDEYITKKK